MRSANLRKNSLLYILVFSVVVRIIYLLAQQPLWWDTHVYIGMGKYIFSSGKFGIWESFRPLLHPLILGFFWDLGFSPIVVGKILDIFFSVLVVFFTYKIAEKVFSKRVAIISSLLLSVTPVFLMFTGLILTDPMAMFFGLAGIYLYVKDQSDKNLFFAGFLLALSFLTRFPMGLFLAAVGIILVFQKEKIISKMRQLFILGSGFIIPVLPYLWFNYQKYGNVFEPFTAGSWIVTTATWLYGSGITYYFREFFFGTLIYVFSFVYLYHFFKEKGWKNSSKLLVVLIPMLVIAYFMYVPRKELRYIVAAVPFLSMMVAAAVTRIYDQLRSTEKPPITPKAFVIICVLLILAFIPAGLHFERPPSFTTEIDRAVAEYNVTGTIMASDPSFISYLDNPILLLGGMTFAPEVYEQHKDGFELLFINQCDLPCPPEDLSCINRRQELLEKVKLENQEIFSKTVKNCSYSIHVPR